MTNSADPDQKLIDLDLHWMGGCVNTNSSSAAYAHRMVKVKAAWQCILTSNLKYISPQEF